MQNNVRGRTLAALLCSVLLCAALFLWLCLPLPSRDVVSLAEQADTEPQNYTERNGVKYVGNGFEVVEFSASVSRGGTAKIRVTADTGTPISIYAYYKSGLSESEAFVSKYVFGDAVWEWTVPKNTATDSIRIVLRTADTYATFNISVI